MSKVLKVSTETETKTSTFNCHPISYAVVCLSCDTLGTGRDGAFAVAPPLALYGGACRGTH